MPDENGTARLRAEAPAFTPSFATTDHGSDGLAHAATFHSSSSQLNSNTSNTPAVRQRRGGRKKQQGQQHQQRSSIKQSLSACGDNRIGNGGNGTDKIHTSASNRKPQRQRNNPRKDRKAKHRGWSTSTYTSDNQQRIVRGADSLIQGVADSASEMHLPLHEEYEFPLLAPSRSSTSTTTTIPPSSWLNSTRIAALVETSHATKRSECDPRSSTIDEFAALGLQKLAPQRHFSTTQKAPSYLAWDVDSKSSKLKEKDMNDVEVDSENEAEAEQIVPIQEDGGRLRRQLWNMTKLRDKWWDAVDRQRAKKTMMAELQRVLLHRIVDPDVDCEEAPLPESVSTALQPHDDAATPDGDTPATELSALQSLLKRTSIDQISSDDEAVVDRIIRERDAAALRELLDIWCDSTLLPIPTFQQRAAKIMICSVQSNLPQLLDILVSRLNVLDIPSISSEKSIGPGDDFLAGVAKALMLAAEVGNEECASIILTRWDSSLSLFAMRDDDGNTVFHYCCRGHGNALLLQRFFRHLSTGTATKSRQQQLAKVLMCKNRFGQTALHIACEHGRVDFVETFLSFCSIALLAKLLAVEDDQTQTPLLAAVGNNASDVVMCLIMWRGNRNLILRNTSQSPGKVVRRGPRGSSRMELQSPPCPMVWASIKGNLDMIQLLLSDPSGQDYRITESIIALLCSDATTDDKVDGSRLLVQNGGNPFEDVEAISCSTYANTAVSVAAKYCQSEVLNALITTGKDQLRFRQLGRRKDPKLRHQPESFFRAIECKEDFEKDRSLANALVECLYRGCVDGPQDDSQISQPLECAVCLYSLGSKLKDKDKARLHMSIKARYLKAASLFVEEPMPRSYVTSYSRNVVQPAKGTTRSDLDRPSLSLYSILLQGMDWFQEQLRRSSCTCSWLTNDDQQFSVREWETWKKQEVLLLTNDGIRFLVHSSIVSGNSAKIASALRFASMKTVDEDSSNVNQVLSLDISSKYCSWMLQHMYHGSIVCGWTQGEPTCQEILELMVIAEEFLCFSLLQECEMRLLHENPGTCFCWHCAKSVKYEEDGTARCLYFASGPSRLLNGNNVLDVLAVLEHLGSSRDWKYEILQVAQNASWVQSAAPSKIWNWNEMAIWSTHAATSLLKMVAIDTALTSFTEVVASVSFRESAEWNACMDSDFKDARTDSMSKEVLLNRILLLQMCLEELSTADLPKAYQRYQSAQKHSPMVPCPSES